MTATKHRAAYLQQLLVIKLLTHGYWPRKT